jgi:hypothetical protein
MISQILVIETLPFFAKVHVFSFDRVGCVNAGIERTVQKCKHQSALKVFGGYLKRC